jgi:hypothetical protein
MVTVKQKSKKKNSGPKFRHHLPVATIRIVAAFLLAAGTQVQRLVQRAPSHARAPLLAPSPALQPAPAIKGSSNTLEPHHLVRPPDSSKVKNHSHPSHRRRARFT